MRKSSLRSFICVMLTMCLLLVSTEAYGAVAIAEPTGYNITTPYEYPVVPGMPEWASFTTKMQMIEVCMVPEETLRMMTTEAVALTAMDYPLMFDIVVYNSLDSGYDAVYNNSNALRELMSREDAVEGLEQARVIAPEYFEGKLNETLWDRLYDIFLSKARKSITPHVFGVALPPVIAMAPAGSVTTPNGSSVPGFVGSTAADHYLTDYKIANDNAYVASIYPSAVQISGVSPAYNCHSYAWHSQSTSNNFWISAPDQYIYINDGSYHSSVVVVGAKVSYHNSDHSAIVYYVGAGTGPNIGVTSKWGSCGVFRHNIDYGPYSNSSNPANCSFYVR